MMAILIRRLWRGGRGPMVATVALCACGGLTTSGALAVAGKPLAITKFTMQTTFEEEAQGLRAKRLAGVGLGPDSFGFANVPYAFTQAGGHPISLTTTIEFEQEPTVVGAMPTKDVKDIGVTLPPGLLGNPTAVPQPCPLKHALAFGVPCPASTQVGEAVLYFGGGLAYAGPIVETTPERGQSAEFAVETNTKINAVLTGHVTHGPRGYELEVVSNGITEELAGVETTFWGVPAAPVHDGERGLFCARPTKAVGLGNEEWACRDPQLPHDGGGGEGSTSVEAPFLTMPSNCAGGPETATIMADSWEEPGVFVSAPPSALPAATGCSLLQFEPSIGLAADTFQADAPVGPEVTVKVPQYQQPTRLATPELRSATVTLPPGMSVSPGIADGIRACDESGPEGINLSGPESEEVALSGELQLAPGKCPDASTVGTAEAITPLLSEPVKGHIYLARPECGGLGERACTPEDVADGKLYKLYLELGGTGQLDAAGIHLKIPGRVEANPATGQLTTRFEGLPVPGHPSEYEGNPQLPFSELRVHLNGGPRAALDTPAACGQAVTTADFKTWSAPGTTPEGVLVEGLPEVTSLSQFPLDLAGDGLATPCSGLAFAPGFVAGTVTPNAGKFTAFTLNISRKDREQNIKGIQVKTPPGLLGALASVPLCGEAQANAGTCGEASKIGTTRVASGAGSHPFEIEGSVYLTGPYDGAPFGLSVATPAVAGPFNLGVVVVRARIDVDPTTSTLTVTTDETGPHAVPQIWMGVPLRLQRITVNVDRPGFMFNPTNCAAQQLTASISASQEAVANVASPFAAGNCTSLAFKPSFKVSTNGHTSRSGGASLDAKLSYPKGAMGQDANIARVKVSLPKQLPSYLPTLQKACLAKTFNANPAACPTGSIVGIARASTPLLPVGLSGPVYFVSHGGEEFPALIIVLQGDGVRVDLIGSTFIDKAGVTSSTFKAIPDVPVNTFELYLPQGKSHALAANADLCTASTTTLVKRTVTRHVHGKTVHQIVTKSVNSPGLVMPTEFIAQNGMTLRQSTKIAVTGCATARPGRGGVARSTRRGSGSTTGRASR